MSESVVNLLLAFCYLIIIALVAGSISYTLMQRHAKKLKTTFVCAADVVKSRKKFAKMVRIALLSDFHIPKMPPDKNGVLCELAKNSPDCVVIAGDLCENKKNWKETAEFVGAVASECKCPTIIVLGNHDIQDACEKNPEKIKEYRRLLESVDENVVTLVDEKYVFNCPGTERSFLFGGLNDFRYNSSKKITATVRKWHNESCDADAEFVLLSHNPDAALYIPDDCMPSVLLSGHTHAGQMWMPFNAEFRFMRKDVLPKKGYKYGLHMYEKKLPIYITSGVGCSFLPIRFRSTAEVAIIDI